MYRMTKLIGLQVRGWISNPLVWLGFLLGLNFMLTPTLTYVRYAESLGERIQVFEPLVMAWASPSMFLTIFLGVLLLLSDAPFINDFSQSALFRTSRVQWAASYILYIALCCLVYFVLLLVFSILIAVPQAYVSDIWSYPIMHQASGAVYIEGLSFTNMAFFQRFTPLQGGLITLGFQVSYSFVLGLLLFFLNMVFNRAVGTVAVLCVHTAGNMIYKDQILLNPRLSLMVHAMPEAHNVSGSPLFNTPTLLESMILWIVLAFVLVGCILWRCKRFDFVVPEKNI